MSKIATVAAPEVPEDKIISVAVNSIWGTTGNRVERETGLDGEVSSYGYIVHTKYALYGFMTADVTKGKFQIIDVKSRGFVGDGMPVPFVEATAKVAELER